jgi:CGNR zinc finger
VSALPSWYPGNEAKPAPMPLLLVQAFLNTRDLEDDTDLLADLPGGRGWLIEAGLLDENAPISERNLELARAVREGMRALLDWGEGGGALGGERGGATGESGGASRSAAGEVLGGAGGDAVGGAAGDALGGERRHVFAPLRAVAAEQRARLSVADDGQVGLENAGHGGVGDALFELLLIVHRAQQDGSWARLKQCANPECQWAFFDRSRNQQGNWCNMAICGNRLKNRQLRARRR